MMTKNGLCLLLLLSLLAPLLSMAQYPAIDQGQGFEVDMEPFYIESDFEGTDPVPLDVKGYFRQEMQVILPNLMGVILNKYEDTQWNSTTASRAFYTGMAVFQGPPFRTNHNVFQAQTAALTSLLAAKTYLHVHSASTGIPEWFDGTALGVKNVQLTEETDGTLTPSDVFGDSHNNSSNKSGISIQSISMGAAFGFVLGTAFTLLVLLCNRHSQQKGRSSDPPSTPRRRHKRKSSDDSLTMDEPPRGAAAADNEDEDVVEEFCDDEEAVVKTPLNISPTKGVLADMDVNSSKSITPRKRRPSHHRRAKSTAFHDMLSPTSVMDGLFATNSPPSSSSSHRRSNSMADAFQNGASHRRSNSMADAFQQQNRRESMVELLAVDLEELQTMDSSEHNDDANFLA